MNVKNKGALRCALYCEGLANEIDHTHYTDDLIESVKHIRRLVEENEQMLEALRLSKKLIDEALPKFHWGASALDGTAIRLLNEVPLVVHSTIIKVESNEA